MAGLKKACLFPRSIRTQQNVWVTANGGEMSLLSHVRLQLLSGESMCAEGLETTAVRMKDVLPGQWCSFLCQVTSLLAILVSAGCDKRFYCC